MNKLLSRQKAQKTELSKEQIIEEWDTYFRYGSLNHTVGIYVLKVFEDVSRYVKIQILWQSLHGALLFKTFFSQIVTYHPGPTMTQIRGVPHQRAYHFNSYNDNIPSNTKS